jgi:hypothetical protein
MKEFNMDNPFAEIEGLSERERALGYLVAHFVFLPEADPHRLAKRMSSVGISPHMVEAIGKKLEQTRQDLNSRQPTIDDLLQTI